METTLQVKPEPEYLSALWAIDPNEQKLRPHSETLAEVRRLLGGSFAKVHPIYICADSEMSLDEAHMRLEEFLQPLGLGPTWTPEVYRATTHKRSEWVERILNLVHSQKDQLILLTSHGRSAVGTLFLGSFANELLKKSNVPILFMSLSENENRQGDQVLFATDFSPESKRAFIKFLHFVKGKTAKIILCHLVSSPFQYASGAAQAVGLIGPTLDDFLNGQKEFAERELNHWLEEARKLSMNVQLQALAVESMYEPSEALEKIADKEQVSLVGLASHVGPFEKYFAGSVTHDLLASHKFNLWVCGPKT